MLIHNVKHVLQKKHEKETEEIAEKDAEIAKVTKKVSDLERRLEKLRLEKAKTKSGSKHSVFRKLKAADLSKDDLANMGRFSGREASLRKTNRRKFVNEYLH